MDIAISLDRIECHNTEDFSGIDECYYMSMVGCEPEPESALLPDRIPVASRRLLLHVTRERALGIGTGDIVRFPPKDRILYPNPSIPAHLSECDLDALITGPVYFFDADTESDEHSPEGQLVRGVVFGHVSGAAAVVMGLMIGGLAGVVTALVLFVGSIIAGALMLKHILSVVDGDDYLGGYQFSVPVQGPPHEEIIFELTGSEDGIVTEKGREFKRTAGTVLYEVVVQVNRGRHEGTT